MSPDSAARIILISVLAVHLILLAVFILYSRSRMYLGVSYYVFAFFVPVFGPLAGILMVSLVKKKKNYAYFDEIVNGIMPDSYDLRLNSNDYVAAEEILLVNGGYDRRKTMLSLLNSNVRKYLDIIKLASYNEDVETSHYATTTIMQIQNDFQNDLGRYRDIVLSGDANESELRDFTGILNEYLSSGIMDEKLLTRYRLMLKSAGKDATEKYGCYDLADIYIGNLVKLGEIAEAISLSDSIIAANLASEKVIRQRVELFILSGDKPGLVKFLRSPAITDMALSFDMKQNVSFWLEDSENEKE